MKRFQVRRWIWVASLSVSALTIAAKLWMRPHDKNIIFNKDGTFEILPVGSKRVDPTVAAQGDHGLPAKSSKSTSGADVKTESNSTKTPPTEEERASRMLDVNSLPDAEKDSVLASGLADPSPMVRSYAASTIGLEKRRSFIPLLTERARQDVPFARRGALIGLGNFKDSSLIPAVEAELNDVNADVRAGAILGLSSIQSPAVVKLLMQQYDTTSDVDDKRFVVAGLVEMTEQNHDLIVALSGSSKPLTEALLEFARQVTPKLDTTFLPSLEGVLASHH